MATSVIEDTRNALGDAIVSAVALLPSWRVHRYPPNTVASPCVYIDMPGLQLLPDAISADWPVTLVVDGSAPAQMQSFDLAIAALWDALDQVENAVITAAYSGAKDIGGMSQRTYTLTVVTYLAHRPLCLLPLSDAVPAAHERSRP
jgi:hypothetical protein